MNKYQGVQIDHIMARLRLRREPVEPCFGPYGWDKWTRLMGAPGAGVGNGSGKTARFSTVFVGVTCGVGDSDKKGTRAGSTLDCW